MPDSVIKRPMLAGDVEAREAVASHHAEQVRAPRDEVLYDVGEALLARDVEARRPAVRCHVQQIGTAHIGQLSDGAYAPVLGRDVQAGDVVGGRHHRQISLSMLQQSCDDIVMIAENGIEQGGEALMIRSQDVGRCI